MAVQRQPYIHLVHQNNELPLHFVDEKISGDQFEDSTFSEAKFPEVKFPDIKLRETKFPEADQGIHQVTTGQQAAIAQISQGVV